MTEVIYIAENEGTAIPFHCAPSGIDPYGAFWVPFETDSFADQDTAECAICEAEIESGYLCMDGGEEVCAEHVTVVPQWNRDILAQDFKDYIESQNRIVAVRSEIGRALIDMRSQHMPHKFLGWTVPA